MKAIKSIFSEQLFFKLFKIKLKNITTYAAPLQKQ